jgi:signal peptidase I
VNEQEKQRKKAESSLASSLFEYVEMFVFAALAVILLMTFALRICVVSGPSMNNTLQNGERLIVSDLFYTPKEGDVIVFHQTSEISDTFNEPIVKRIIATGGKHVRIDYDQKLVYVSEDESFTEDEIIDESSYAYFTNEKWTLRGASDFHVPEGHLFVMGDNRNNSADSRDALLVGFVDERRVLGKVLLRIMPLNAFGKVD